MTPALRGLVEQRPKLARRRGLQGSAHTARRRLGIPVVPPWPLRLLLALRWVPR